MLLDSFLEARAGPIQARGAATAPHWDGKPLGWFPSLAIEYSVKLLHEHRLRTSTEGQDSARHHASHRTLHGCRARRRLWLAWTHWQNWVSLVLGVILFITPWVFGTATK